MTKKWYSLFSGRGRKTKNLTYKNMKLKKKNALRGFTTKKKRKRKRIAIERVYAHLRCKL